MMLMPNMCKGFGMPNLWKDYNAQRVKGGWNPFPNSQDWKIVPRILCDKKDWTTYAKGFTALIKNGQIGYVTCTGIWDDDDAQRVEGDWNAQLVEGL